MEKLTVKTVSTTYDVIIGSGTLSLDVFPVSEKQKTLIVTDAGVPKEYIQSVDRQVHSVKIVTLEMGEKAKSVDNLMRILNIAACYRFSRNDAFIAIGGGVVGDIVGLASSLYMRGVRFINCPTTLLSQVDSSIGGKTAVNFNNVKNLLGSFYPPSLVVIDIDTLNTLSARQFANGFAEIIKSALICDAELFDLLNHYEFGQDVSDIIFKTLSVKKSVVERDEFESGERRILNFGHTIGHAVEAFADGELLHGECVALGMLPMCSPSVREKLIPLYQKIGLPTSSAFESFDLSDLIRFDKKGENDNINAVFVNEIGKCEIVKKTVDEIVCLYERCYK